MVLRLVILAGTVIPTCVEFGHIVNKLLYGLAEAVKL